MYGSTNITSGTAKDLVFTKLFKLDNYVATLGGALTVAVDYPPVLILDPGGAARTVTLPAEADAEKVMFMIVNTADAAEDITVEDDAAATVVTVSQNEAAIVYCDGTNWHGLVGGIT